MERRELGGQGVGGQVLVRRQGQIDAGELLEAVQEVGFRQRVVNVREEFYRKMLRISTR